MPAQLTIALIWGFLLPFLAAFFSTALILWLYTLPVRRLPRDAHWSEVARCYWGVRAAKALSSIWVVMGACAFVYQVYTERDELWMVAVVALAALLGCAMGIRQAEHGLRLPESLRKRRGLAPKLSLALLFPGGISTLAIMVLTWPRGLGMESYLITAVLFLVNIALIMGGSVALLRLFRLLKPVADGEIVRFSREQAEQQGISLRHVLQMELPMANAFAFPWTRDIAFTSTALDSLDREEIQSVISHELGHLKESLSIRWLRMAGLPTIAAIGLAPAAIKSGQPLVALLLFGVHFGVSRLVARNYKRLEVAADREAHGAEANEGVYARALEKIHAASLIPAVLQPNNPYPSLYDRMTSAGVTPDFNRPKPPNRWLPFVVSAITAAGFILFWQTTSDAVKDYWNTDRASGVRP
jgi:Zn-dependent protease with chaperone function